MRDDQIFGLIAGVALLFWLGRGYLPVPYRRRAEILALILVALGMGVALVWTVLWFAAR
jgi:hypothetical protein